MNLVDTTTGDGGQDTTWSPSDVIHPGACPPHLSRAMRAAIEAGRQAEEDRLKLIRQRTEERP